MSSFTFSQGSNNSDQSSGYLSGGGGGCQSLPPNAAVDDANPFEFKYGPSRIENLGDKYQGHEHNDHRHMKKLSLTSSIGDYCSSSNNEQYTENKWVQWNFCYLLLNMTNLTCVENWRGMGNFEGGWWILKRFKNFQFKNC